MGQKTQRKSSKTLLEEKHMKNYFRTLKRSKSKGMVHQEPVMNKEIKNRKIENINNLDQAPENKEKKIINHLKQKQMLLENDYNRLNDTQHTTDSNTLGDTNKTEDDPKKENVLPSGVDFSEVSFWREPLPQVDTYSMSENIFDVKNAKTSHLEDNKVFPVCNQSEGQFNAAAFWKDPIPEVNLSELIENNSRLPNVEEDNVAKAKNQMQVNGDVFEKSDTQEMTTELVKMIDELTDKMEVLEKENKSLRNCLGVVKDDIASLETRIRTLEAGNIEQEKVFSSAIQCPAKKIVSRH
eukprot:GFUD01032872.1.p1 GENE.GFUD01032872.1~~GFUD01032872.1.p1  ORF type:complete len:311 (-),score=105.07 GFUD01032872.1:98-985(-)